MRAGHALPSAPLFETYDQHQFEHINKILATNLPFDVQLVKLCITALMHLELTLL